MSKLFTGGPYKTNAGVSITVNSTKVNGGAIKSPSTQSDLTRNSNYFTAPKLEPVSEGGVGGKAAADYGTGQTPSGRQIVQATALGYSGLAKLLVLSHSFATGNGIRIIDTQSGLYSGVYRVVNIVDANNVILNTPYLGTVTGFSYYNQVGNLGSQIAKNFVMKKLGSNLHGVASTKLQSGAADFNLRDPVKKVNAVRTRKMATAIRNGQYNIFTGQFTSRPDNVNDFASMDIDGTNIPDDETKFLNSAHYGVGGRFTYRAGQRTPASGIYDNKTD